MSLDDLVALNDEIAGLVRSGVPLELGLASWGGDLPGQLGRTVTRLGAAIERGQSLSESLAADASQIPPVYGALVAAGLRSGRLPSALESLATSARNLKEVRSAIGLAILYPLMLLLVAYFLVLLLIMHVIPSLLLVYEARPPKFWSQLAGLGAGAGEHVFIPFTGRGIAVAFLPPVAIVAAAVVWWFRTRRAIVLDGGAAGWWLRSLPVAGRAVRHARTAALAEILGLLVEHGVPLDESIVLAAECTGDRKLVQSSQGVAASIRQGAAPSAQLDGLPPLLAWLVASGGQQQTFTTMARHVADTNRRLSLHEAQWLRDFLPIWLIVIVGGSLVALAGVLLFLPFSQLMETLSGPVGNSMRIKP
jgi:type II secretory pathway component PulF